jgi:L-threonylcarbamoyladenylate synthase
MTEITKNVDIIVKEIMDGNVAAIPTETVYGLGANALNENAVVKIYEIKERPAFNPLIVHIFGMENIYKYADDVPEKAMKLMECFSPGPISYVLKKKDVIPDIVTAGRDTVAVRFPWHPMFIEVLKQIDVPVSAPSANKSGRISPTSAEDVMRELNGKIGYILDGGRCTIGIESTVVSFDNEDVSLLRPGYITKEEIEGVVGKINEDLPDSGSGRISPGLLKHHYAPATDLYLTDNPQKIMDLSDGKAAFLDFGKYRDAKEIAVNLFSDIIDLDERGYEFIVAAKVENSGLGLAINDRLEKASSGYVNAVARKLKFTSR